MADKLAGNVQIQLYFVIPVGYLDEGSVSVEMKLAYSNAADWNLKPQWIKEEDCATVDSTVKGNVFVFEKFTGDNFKDFIGTYRRARVVGPKCLLSCFSEQLTIPNTKFPVYNLAMNGFLVSASIKPPEAKERIVDLIGYMGGNYTNVLTTSTTHLVVSSIMSEKYLKAKEVGIPVLKSEWVEEVWQRSLVGDVKGNDEVLMEEFLCPMFHKLSVATSQLNESEKRKVKKMIEDGGGTFSPDLVHNVNNLLILRVGRGEKFKFAQRWKVKCVTPGWLQECMAKGYAVSYDKFIVQPENKCSTPIGSYNHAKMGRLVDTEDTDISSIPSGNGRSVVTETLNFESQTQNAPILRNDIFKTPVKNFSRNEKINTAASNLSCQNILDSINLNDIKKCQHLLDGCKVYLMGFNLNEEEKLRRMLNYGGAIRFIDLNESLTHVIVGNPNSSEIEALKNLTNKPHIVKLGWLAASISKGCLERESDYAFFDENNEPSNESSVKVMQQPSPLSKKGLQMLNAVRHIPVNSHPIVGVDQILIEKYASPQESANNGTPLDNFPGNSMGEESHSTGNSVGKQPQNGPTSIREEPRSPRNSIHDEPRSATNSMPEEPSSARNTIQQESRVTKNSGDNESQRSTSGSLDKLFVGLRFALFGHSTSLTSEIRNSLREYGGTVVSNTHSVVDYTVVPFTNVTLKVTSHEVVTLLWIQECLSAETVVDVKYYHKPVTLPDLNKSGPLDDCVLSFSCYNDYEKQYLVNVAAFLGARCQDVLAKKTCSERKIAQTTHLVSSRAEGVKYNAAKKWNLPVVKSTWLLACLSAVAKLPVEDFGVTSESEITSQRSSSKIASKSETTSLPKLESKKPHSLMKTAIMANASAAAKTSENSNVTPDVTDKLTNVPLNASVHQNTSKSFNKLSFKLNSKPAPVERTPVTTPSIAEAVQRSTQRNGTDHNRSLKNEATAKKNWPTGLLLEINACASSSVKRKLECQATDADQTPQVDCQRKKVLRHENTSSSPYEEVGWQDTLTDLSNVQMEQADSGEKNDGAGSTANKNGDVAKIVEKPATTAQSRNEDDSATSVAEKNPVSRGHSSSQNENTIKHRRNVYGNFLISVPSGEWRAECEQIITKLGGRVLSVFPTDCAESEKATHMIIDELKKTEKLLCSIASGIWVLHSSYIEECEEAQTFLAEEKYEWGNPLNERLMPKKGVRDYGIIARAAHRWRLTISKGGLTSRPFIGMKAVIISTPNDEAVHSLTRVVKSGGGLVLPICDILSSTHCLLKSPKLDLIPVPLERLASKKIHCTLAVYLSDYLMNDPPPDVKACYFDVYKRLF